MISLIRTNFWKLLQSEYLVFGLTVVYFLALLPLAEGLSSGQNLLNIGSNLLPLLVVALGQTLVMISRGIDLSVSSTIALCSVVGAKVMSNDGGLLANSGWAVPGGLVSMLLVGVMVGSVNGALVGFAKMPPFMVTLTTMMFFSGVAIWFTDSKPIFGLPANFNAIGKNLMVTASLTLLLVVVLHTLLRKTVSGRWLYAAGSNPTAAKISGVPVARVLFNTYVISGLCAAIASMMYTGRLETGSPVLGQRILLDVIGATVIGGTSLFGGKGKLLWTFFGVLFLTLLDNTLNLLNLSQFSIMMCKGGVILLAATLDSFRSRNA